MTTEIKTGEPEIIANASKKILKLAKILGLVVWGLIIALGLSMVFFLAQYKLTGGPPHIFGQQMYIVLSGSMEPTFHTRSLIFVKPAVPEEIRPGDIITFSGQDGNKSLTTHRVVEIENTAPGQINFITKGDANQVNDPSPVAGEKLIGRATWAIPYLGVVLSFAQTKQGLLLFIIVPGCLLILMEAYKLINNLRRPDKPECEEG